MDKGTEIKIKIKKAACLILGICAAGVITGLFVEQRIERVEAKVSRTQKELAKEVLRFHVLANSDSEEDQAVKQKVRDAVLVYMEKNMAEELTERPDVERTKAWVESHLKELEGVADRTVEEEGYTYGSRAEVEVSYFPDRRYGDVFFPQGEYEALKIRLGKAKGHNWWCVLYPGLCFTDTTCAVVSDEGKKGLKEALTAEEYELVTATSEFKIKWFFLGED